MAPPKTPRPWRAIPAKAWMGAAKEKTDELNCEMELGCWNRKGSIINWRILTNHVGNHRPTPMDSQIPKSIYQGFWGRQASNCIVKGRRSRYIPIQIRRRKDIVVVVPTHCALKIIVCARPIKIMRERSVFFPSLLDVRLLEEFPPRFFLLRGMK